MSLDISVYNPETEQTIEMNWLRNPYGLCNWAESNYLYAKKREPKKTLWYVINHWNYAKAPRVNRKLFLEAVMLYGSEIMALQKGYFWFDISSYIQFVQPYLHVFPQHDPLAKWGIGDGSLRIDGTVYHDKEIGIPMDYFANPCFHLSDKYRPNAHALARYQKWYQQLIDFAKLLQVPGTTFYCSN
jgi:hypothetical protein